MLDEIILHSFQRGYTVFGKYQIAEVTESFTAMKISGVILLFSSFEL